MEPAELSPRMRALAFVMRRMPKDVRKTCWWWERLYRGIGGGGFTDDPAVDSQWPRGLQAPVATRRFGYKVRLDVSLWPDRRTYFGGGYYQAHLEHLYAAVLRPGDQYLDIGANIGMTALMAAATIGEDGRGFAFEPNPETFERLRINFDVNPYKNVELVHSAVADTDGEAVLHLPSVGNTGIGSLAGTGDGGRSYTVRIATGDRYLERLDPSKPTFVKIDVEGYEVKVLKGIERALDWPELALIAEVNSDMLARAGDSVEALEEALRGHGLEPYTVALETNRFDRKLKIAGPIASLASAIDEDILFLRPGSSFRHERLAGLITPA